MPAAEGSTAVKTKISLKVGRHVRDVRGALEDASL
jgi:hypothetical protein